MAQRRVGSSADRNQFIAVREQIFGDHEITGDAYADVKPKLADYSAFHEFVTERLIKPIFSDPVCGDGR